MYLIRDLNSVAVGLTVDVDEQRGLSICCNDRVDGLDRGHDSRNVAYTHGDSRLRGPDHKGGNLLGSAHLPINESENKLVMFLQQSGRIDEVGPSYRLQDVVHGHARHQQFRGVGDDVELRFLTALDQDGRNAVQAVQTRLDFVRNYFPQLGLV